MPKGTMQSELFAGSLPGGASLEALGSLLQALPLGALLVDESGTVLFANQAVEKHLGCSYKEAAGAKCCSLIHGPAWRQEGCGLLHNVGGSTERVAIRNGRSLLMRVRHTGLLSPAGKPLMIHLVEDVTDRKRAEQEIEQQRWSQVVVAEILQATIDYKDLGTMLSHVLCLLASVPWLDSLPQGAIYLAPPARGAGLELRASLGLDTSFATEHAVIERDQCLCGQPGCRLDAASLEQLCPHGVYRMPIRVQGGLGGLLMLWAQPSRQASDGQTALLESASALLAGALERRKEQDARTLLAAAMEQSAEALLIADHDGRISYANARSEEMLATTRAQLVGQQAWEVELGLEEESRARLEEVVARGERWAGPAVLRQRDGSIRYYHLSAAPVQQDGKLVFVLSLRDLTEQHELERQLRHVQKMDALGRLAGGVAHDFNNLLQVVMGAARLLREDLPPDHQGQEDLAEVEKVARRGAALTRQLLAFSRRERPERRPLDLDAVVEDMDSMLRRSLGGGQIEMQVEPGTRGGVLLGDWGQLEQVLLNLVINARDAMPKGGRLSVRTGRENLAEARAFAGLVLSPGPYLTLTVEDTGVGIPPEILEKIFEPFFTTKPAGQGTGLGLATVYGIVQQWGGAIEVHSMLGQGSLFCVYLPEARGEAPRAGGPEKAHSARGAETVLLVEDDPSVLRLVERMLAAGGYRVLVASEAAEALELLRENRGNLAALISDVMLGRDSGPKLAEDAHRELPALPTLFISGHPDDELRRGGITARENVLRKPFQPQLLLETLRGLLDRRAA